MSRFGPRLIAVDLTFDQLACARFRRTTGHQTTLEALETVDLPTTRAPDPRAWVAAVGAAARRVTADDVWKGACHVAVPAPFVLTKALRLPAVKEARRERLVAFEAQHHLPAHAGPFIWDHGEVSPRGAEVDLHLAAMRTELATELCQVLEAAGWPPVRVTSGVFALARLLERPEVEPGTLLLRLGRFQSDLLCRRDGRLWTRAPAWGSASVDGEASTGKPPHDGPTPDRVRLLAARLRMELARLEAIEGDEATAGGQQLLLTGREASAALGAELEGWLRREVKVLDPERLAGPGARKPGARLEVLPALWGLANLAGTVPRRVNLVPPQVQARRQRHRRRRIGLATAILAELALLAVGLYQEDQYVRARQVAVEVARRVEHEDASRVARQHELTRARQKARQSAEERQAEDRRLHWVRLLHDLHERVSASGPVWLETLKVRTDAGGGRPAGPARTGSLTLSVAGRWLDQRPDALRSGTQAYLHVRRLLEALAASPYVVAVGEERFEWEHPRLLRFAVALEIREPGAEG